MKRTREKVLRDIVVTKDDLRSIYSLVCRSAEAGAAPDGSRHPPVIRVESEGSVTTEMPDDSVFDDDVIDRRRTERISFRYRGYRIGRSVDVTLAETNKEYVTNSLTVAGDDRGWVDSTFSAFEELFGACRPQSTFARRRARSIFALMALAIGYSWLTLIYAAFSTVATVEVIDPQVLWLEAHHAVPVLAAPICFLAGTIPASMLTARLVDLWPLVEFDFGPEHLKRRKTVRARVTWVATAVVLPLAVALGVEAIKGYWLGW